MNFEDLKARIFSERPGVKKEYDALASKYEKIKEKIRRRNYEDEWA